MLIAGVPPIIVRFSKMPPKAEPSIFTPRILAGEFTFLKLLEKIRPEKNTGNAIREPATSAAVADEVKRLKGMIDEIKRANARHA